ncbi:hypothetical protein [Pseudovibrio sp. Ad37]|uniref:hypothetical protein n=1 Tax=Pseudovibrio sp. Ad37 TaxID=989422 RepID=UPI0007AEBF7A|nr:hypothetical protein [Pseudovibrio sp. Ad37]KZL19685.1 hypothetical protein PsAD37_03674 [Pseudovibrio sp. Ad37]
MHFPKLKQSGVVFILNLAMLGVASSQVILREHRANPFTDMKRVSPSRHILVDNLTVLTDAVGIEFCKERYRNGTTVYPDPDGRHGQFISQENDKLTLYDRSELRQDGIYTEHSQLVITFKNDPDVEVKVTVFITGFVNSKMFSGVFSDGICTGHFSVVEAK